MLGGPVGVGVAVAAALLGLGGYRLVTFVQSIRDYRDRAKTDTCQAPPAWLAVPGRTLPKLQLFRINDQVMGGRSVSSLEAKRGGSVDFRGTISTTGGGFASFRTLGDDEPLGVAPTTRALRIEATGDGQRYKATLHTADSWAMRVPSWSADFRTKEAQRGVYELPLAHFVPSRQGRVVSGAGTIDAAAVTGIGFGLSLYTADGKPNPEFRDGPFNLEVHSAKFV